MQINELAAVTGTAAGGMGIACPAAVFQGTASSNDIGYEGGFHIPLQASGADASVRGLTIERGTAHRPTFQAGDAALRFIGPVS